MTRGEFWIFCPRLKESLRYPCSIEKTVRILIIVIISSSM